MKKIIIFILVLSIILTTFYNVYADVAFSDVKTRDWFYKNVIRMVDLGIVNGYPDKTFRPDNNLAFEEFIKMLVIASEGNNIEPVSGANWYTPYTNLALEKGYISKKDMLSVGKKINRESMANIIYNVLLNTEGIESLVEKELDFICNMFSDLELEDEKILHIAQVGIINGYPDKTFKPGGYLTRAEATTVILKVLDESMRTPIEIVLPKELSDFPYPDTQYLKDYPTPDGKTVEESHEHAQKTQPYSSMEKAVDDFTNFMGMLVNRDYRTIKSEKLNFNYQPVFVDKSNYKTLSYRNWFLYYTNGYKEYKGVVYKDLRSDWVNNSTVYNDPSIMWFEYFLDRFIDDSVKNKVIVEGQFYTEPEMFICIDGLPALRGVLRFKYESHLDSSNIKNELDLVPRNIMYDRRRMATNLGINNDYSMYLDFKSIKSFEINQWYEIGLDIVINTQSPVNGIENIIGEQAQYNYNYIYPIYINKLQ